MTDFVKTNQIKLNKTKTLELLLMLRLQLKGHHEEHPSIILAYTGYHLQASEQPQR